jgi:hypothetical protein
VLLPRWCAFGNRIELLDETRCEVCYTLDQQGHDGKSQRDEVHKLAAAPIQPLDSE